MVVWLFSRLGVPIRLDNLNLYLGETHDLRARKRLNAENGWMSPSVEPIESFTVPSPRATQVAGHRSHMLEDETLLIEEGFLWRVDGPVVVKPGINEIVFTPKSTLPPPSTYVFERLTASWGALTLEQDHLVVLDPDTLEAAQGTNRPLRRRIAAYSRQPSKQGISFTIVPRPPATAVQLLNYPIMPPDTTKDHQLCIMIETHRDTVSGPVLTVSQRPTIALAPQGEVSLRFFAATSGKGGD